ncbi:MAG TPA: glycosidase [Armatimonadota bacterium]
MTPNNTMDLVRRYENNPILEGKDVPYLCNTMFNAGATTFRGETLLLLRIEDRRGYSHLTVATSKDGISNWNVRNTPFMVPGLPEHPYEAFGVEDARITFVPETGDYLITYTAYSFLGAGVALAKTRDWETVERLGLIFPPNNKDACVFPKRINGEWVMLHRPVSGDAEHMWLAFSPDLHHWGHHKYVLLEASGPRWDAARIGAGTVPIETPEGWLILYHGVKYLAGSPIYRVGAALLDLDHPDNVIARLPYWIMSPTEPYETQGDAPNVVFPAGCIEHGDDLHIYYGAADSRMCLAFASISGLVEALKRDGVPPLYC